MKKGFIWIIVIAVVAAGAYFYFRGSGNDNSTGPIKTVKVKRADLKLEIVSTGTVTPDVEVVVKSKAGGEITSFPFNEGDKIKKGETVVKLDPKTEETRTKQAEAVVLISRAKLDKARVSLKDAEVKLKRSKELFGEGIISRQELDDAEITLEKSRTDLKLAEAEVLQSEEAFKEAKERLDDTQIKAPFTGTILNKDVDVGHVISSTLSSASEGTPLFTMANLDNIYVNAQVDEVDISRVAVGQTATVAVDSLPGRTFNGRVERIAPKGKVERTVTIFDVVIIITDKDKELLKPGMTAAVSILTDIVKDALIVPNEALRTKNGATGVYVMQGGSPNFVKVETGKTDGILTELRSGVKEGEEVVTSSLKQNEPKKKKRFFF
ncbi:MAG TPA: efflux RND transporter periplasmic adaptor subunit [Thermodesulfobacteriota bacterium]|nr:efflux RND transporter periplasmic adaptor subunit [Thermodesulfobacteriota bacterium]